MSDSNITLRIDGHQITVPSGTTILEAARQEGIDIPVICYHEATTSNGICRLCVVDVNDQRVLKPACVEPCRDGMQVQTNNDRVQRSRRTILEMLNASTDLSESEEIQGYMADLGADVERFPEAVPRDFDVIDDNPFYIRDYGQCVLCWRCVQVCAEDAQYTFALTLAERGYHTHVSTSFEIDMTESPCVFCGQCIGVCPTGALKPRIEWLMEQDGDVDEAQKQMRRGMRRRKS